MEASMKLTANNIIKLFIDAIGPLYAGYGRNECAAFDSGKIQCACDCGFGKKSGTGYYRCSGRRCR